MQELLGKHMIGTFAIEIAALTVALSIIGFIGMRLRARRPVECTASASTC